MRTRDGRQAEIIGKGILGNMLVGTIEEETTVWFPDKRWRMDSVDHPNDIVEE